MIKPLHTHIARAGLSLSLLCTACEKEIGMDYRTTQPHYVAEVSLTPTKVTARISTTQDVTSKTYTDTGVRGATVTVYITGQADVVDTLSYRGNGIYECDYWGMAGYEYNVDVCIDGQHYTSASTMHKPPVMNNFRFVWRDVLTESFLFADLRLQDVPDEISYYFAHLYRNGIGYRWAVINDKPNPGAELQQLFSCCTRRDIDRGATTSDVLHEGDNIRLEVRSIDKAAYDYLYSLQLMDNSGTNPIPNFSNGLLGYFSAYQSVRYETVFRLADVEQDK